MLKDDGVVFHYEGMKHCGLTYLKFSPEWFFDYYALNNFFDFQAYILAYNNYFQNYSILEYSAYYQDIKSLQYQPSPAIKIFGEAMIIVIAQKKKDSSCSLTPIQEVYRSDSEIYLTMHKNYVENNRRKAIGENLILTKTQKIHQETSKSSSFKDKIYSLINRGGEKVIKNCILEDYPFEQTLGYKHIGYTKSVLTVF